MPVIHEDGNYLTEKGRALIAKLMASKSEIQFTRAAVGAGTIPEGMAPKDMTDLADWRADGLISDISTPVPGEAQLVFQVFSRDVPVGFLASEGAVWAMDPDEGGILYTYIVLANSPEWIRAANDPVQKFAEFTCINIVDAVKVDITMVNPEAIATLGMLKNRLETFVELSDAEAPAVGTRVHLRVLEQVETWADAPAAKTTRAKKGAK